MAKVMTERQCVTTAEDLGKYVAKRFFCKKGVDISNLKLQKTLFFLFGYWGGFARKGKGKKTEIGCDLPEYLFNDKIEAWTYGPVIPTIFHNQDEIKRSVYKDSSSTDIFHNNEIKDFVDELCDEIFGLSDFKLVEIAHHCHCWIDHYNDGSLRHNIEIPKEDIINEFAQKI